MTIQDFAIIIMNKIILLFWSTMHHVSLSHLLRFWKGKIVTLMLQLPSETKFFLRHSYSQKGNADNGTSSTCNYVIFRLDDIPYDLPIYDENRINIDLAVMDVFHKKNQNLSLGLVMHHLDHHPKLLKNIIDGYNKGLFELAIHGWDHLNYSKLSKTDQESSLRKANEKMQCLFGKPPKIFIPPYNEFNGSTLDVLKRLGIRIISSSLYSDYHEYFVAKGINKSRQTDEIYHLPEMASFETFQAIKPIRVPLERIVNNVERQIPKYGYAVITIHPQSLVKFTDGKSTQLSLKESNLDMDRIVELDALIQMIIDRNISITTFSKLVEIE